MLLHALQSPTTEQSGFSSNMNRLHGTNAGGTDCVKATCQDHKPDMWEAFKMTALSLASRTETIRSDDGRCCLRDDIHLNYGGHGLRKESAARKVGGIYTLWLLNTWVVRSFYSHELLGGGRPRTSNSARVDNTL